MISCKAIAIFYSNIFGGDDSQRHVRELQLRLQVEWPVVVGESKREVYMVIRSYSTAGMFQAYLLAGVQQKGPIPICPVCSESSRRR